MQNPTLNTTSQINRLVLYLFARNTKNISLYFTIGFILICFFCQGQVVNDNRLNYEVQLTSMSFNKNSDGANNQEEPTLLMAVADDDNGISDALMATACNSAQSANIRDQEFFAKLHCPCTIDDIDLPIEFIENTSATLFDYHEISFEWDGTDPRNIYHCDDDHGESLEVLYPIKYGGQNEWRYDTNTRSTGQTTLRLAWRYTNGEASSPLDFGTLGTSQRSHTNSNRIRPSGSNTKIGYPNNDVYYKFTVPSDGGRYLIDATQDYNNTISLYDDQNTLIETITNAAGTSGTPRILQNLCQGTYTIKVGSNGPNGNFTLYIVPQPTYSISGGSIAASQSTICEGIIIPQINSITAANDGHPNDITYQWQKSENNQNNFINIPSATSAQLFSSQTGIMPMAVSGQDYVRFRRLAYSCGANEKASNIVTITAPVTTIDPGSIQLLVSGGATSIDNYTIPCGIDPGSLGSESGGNGSGTPGPITYRWELSSNNGASWSTVGNTTASYDPIASVFTTAGTYQIRRIAINDCGQEAESNIFSVIAFPKDGSITGTVSSPSGIGGPGAGVSGVTVTAVRTTSVEGGDLVTDTYTTESNTQGLYTISDIYYGPGTGADFTVTPTLDDNGFIHTFTPTDYSGDDAVALKSTLKSAQNIDFTDNSTFSFSGRVFQTFEGLTVCGMDTVEIKLNGQVLDSTDVNGHYAISIPSIGTYTIDAVYRDFMFTATFDNTDLFINGDSVNMDFENIKTQHVLGTLSDGCGDAIPGVGTISFTDSLNCISNMVSTTIVDGQYDIELPARRYKVAFSHPDPAVEAFFNLTQYVDLTDEDQTLDFKYRQAPVIEVVGMPDVLGCAAPYDIPLLEQAVTYPLTINIYEGVIGGCPVDTGFVILTDNISDRDGMEISLEFNNGTVVYDMFPGGPNLTAPHLKSITVAAKDTFDQQSTVFQQSAVVTGARAREQTFTTVTPEIPLMILRDPPGDGSYSFINQTETIELATSFSKLEGGSINTWREVKLGTQFEAGFIGFDTETEIWGSINGALEVGATSTSSTENLLSMSTSQTFSTSSSDDFIGETSDVFIGAAMNLLYASADIITFDQSTCQVNSDVDLIIKNDGFATEYVYTEQYIRERVIPQLEFIAINTLVQDSVKFYEDQIKVWEQVLERNNELKRDANFVLNRSFSAGAGIEYSETAESSSTLSIEFLSEINTDIAVEAGFEIAGSGAAGGVAVNLKFEFGESKSETTTKSLTTGYYLFDDDAGDGFALEILTDPVYMTPVFKLISGITSCPWEQGTQPRDEPMLTAVNPIMTNVAVDEEAEFILQLMNTSQSGEDRTYHLKLNQESNPDGAEVKIGGSPYTGPVPYFIPYGGSSIVSVEVGKGTSTIFTYEGLEFELYSDCDPDIKETIALTTFFSSPCSDVALFAPIDGWVINSMADEIDVHIKDYVKANLDEIQIEYAEVGASDWQTISVVAKTSLAANGNIGTIVPVNVSSIPDGEFNIRLKLICGFGTTFSMRAQGTIDTRAPERFGIPLPIDDIYDQADNDVIAVAFDEDIDCSTASVVFTRLDNNNEVIAASFSCVDNVATIVPNLLLNYPGAFRVSLIGIEDVYGNISAPVNWVFITPGYEIDDSCGPLAISNNNVNQDAISQNVYVGTTLTSDGYIAASNSIDYIAETSISLNAGFEVSSDATFSAVIEDCPN